MPRPTPAAGAGGRVRLTTIILVRWIAVAGQASAIVLVGFALGYDLPVVACLATVAALAVSNLYFAAQYRSATRLSDRAAAMMLGFDILQLAALLYLTGGSDNPFLVLMLAPVAIGASVLSLRSTAALTAIALLCVAALAIDHFPLPWATPGAMAQPPLYTFAVSLALAVGMVFVAIYAWRVAEEGRRMSDALAA
ncbi:MAG: sensor histidine kinase, partial [Alphaproteobacteria bacterium]|nr:sensor histidine kinase [Alphaproteobacteria bacterium]